MKALIIYTMVPGNTQAFSLEVTSEDMKTKLMACHSNYINLINDSDPEIANNIDEHLNWLGDILDKLEPIYDEEQSLINHIDLKQFDMIIITGFVQ